MSVDTKRRKLAQISVCHGSCCCGREDKGYAPVPAAWLKAQWKERKLLKLVQLSISGCLGPCDMANVVKISTVGGNTWIAAVNGQPDFDQLTAWAVEVNRDECLHPLPDTFRDRGFDPFD